MKIWQSWAGNHSADFGIVGTFETEKDAREAFDMLNKGRFGRPYSSVSQLGKEVIVGGESYWEKSSLDEWKVLDVDQIYNQHYEVARLASMDALKGVGAKKLYWGGDYVEMPSDAVRWTYIDDLRSSLTQGFKEEMTSEWYERGPRITQAEINSLSRRAEEVFEYLYERGRIPTRRWREIKPKMSHGNVRVRPYMRRGRPVRGYTRRRPRRR